jgi:hypothetical protein
MHCAVVHGSMIGRLPVSCFLFLGRSANQDPAAPAQAVGMRKRTAVAMATGRYSTALACAGEALERLGHPMPTSTFALCAAAAWQCLRQFTHRLQLGLSLGMSLVLIAFGCVKTPFPSAVERFSHWATGAPNRSLPIGASQTHCSPTGRGALATRTTLRQNTCAPSAAQCYWTARRRPGRAIGCWRFMRASAR